MISSMTGFGKGESSSKKGKSSIEIQSINRKHLEIQVSISREFIQFEQEIRQIIARKLSRGRINVFVNFTPAEEQNKEYIVDFNLAKDYLDAANELSEDLDYDNNLTLKDILQNRDIIRLEQKEADHEGVKDLLFIALEEALVRLIKMRAQEGEFLLQDIQERLNAVHLNLKQVQSLISLSLERYKEKLENKINEILTDSVINRDRILTEVAIVAEKTDITEEIVRLNSHLEQFQNILEEEGPAGRPLDFIAQEMMRETGTILAKSIDKDISQLILEVKIELDKIREQLQNIE